MSSVLKPDEQDDGLEAAVDQAIAVCDGDPRAAVRALIVANTHLESEIADMLPTGQGDPYRMISGRCSCREENGQRSNRTR
jgi:hypothetical protein